MVVNTGRAGTCNWRWFEIDAHLGAPQATLTAAITYGDGESASVRRERIALGPGLPGLASCDEREAYGNVHTLILSPFFVHYHGDGYHVSDVVLTRAMVIRGETTFSMAESREIQTLTVESPNPSDSYGDGSLTEVAWSGR